ncbi:hypothetical protein ES702_05273 [subsurface metagenome]
MSTHTLQLLKIPSNYKKGTLPYGPKAYIALKSYGGIELPTKSGKEKTMFSILSPECLALNEIKYEINRLIQELQTIKKQAKGFFQKEDQKRQGFCKRKVQ